MEENNGITPEALEKRVFYPETSKYYVDAFNILSSRRPTDTFERPIPLSEIKAYLDIYKPYDRDMFLRIIFALDEAYLTYKSEKVKSTLDKK